MARWLLKTDPGTYSFDDLARERVTRWDGIRNHQARNNLAAMKAGDGCLIYHSEGAREVVGTAAVLRAAYSEPGAGDPRWLCVDIRAGKRLPRPVALAEIKSHAVLSKMALVRQGRLSVCPVSETEWTALSRLAARSHVRPAGPAANRHRRG